jgi:hypothetical protein
MANGTTVTEMETLQCTPRSGCTLPPPEHTITILTQCRPHINITISLVESASRKLRP